MPRLLWFSAALAVFIATRYFEPAFGSLDACGSVDGSQTFGAALCNPVMRVVARLALGSFAFWIIAGTGTLLLGGADFLAMASRRLRRSR